MTYPIADCDEPQIEETLAPGQNGFKDILEFCVWAEETGVTFRTPTPHVSHPIRGHPTCTAPEWVTMVDCHWNDKRRAIAGSMLASFWRGSNLGETATSAALAFPEVRTSSRPSMVPKFDLGGCGAGYKRDGPTPDWECCGLADVRACDGAHGCPG